MPCWKEKCQYHWDGGSNIFDTYTQKLRVGSNGTDESQICNYSQRSWSMLEEFYFYH